jgi:hypothetical protein
MHVYLFYLAFPFISYKNERKNIKSSPVLSVHGGKNMKKRIGQLMLCMLALVLLIPLATAYQPSDEILDQKTPLSDGDICGINNEFLAQSFKPKLPVLSRVELGLFRDQNITGNFTVSIRERLNGADLVTKTVSIEEVPWMIYADWVSIDFQDINVTPNKRYYIVFTSDDTRCISWVLSPFNPYWRGRGWSMGGQLPFWIPAGLIVTRIPDMTFQTYGYESTWSER